MKGTECAEPQEDVAKGVPRSQFGFRWHEEGPDDIFRQAGGSVSGSRRQQHEKEEGIMDLIVERVNVWAAPIKDEAGGLAHVLTGLREAGADLDFIISRRTQETPGAGVAFVTPLRADSEIAAAAQLGFNVTNSVYSLRVEGPNQRGVAAELTAVLANEGLTLRGFSASVSGARFVAFIGFDSSEDAAKASEILKNA
jgi:hypothetical protein